MTAGFGSNWFSSNTEKEMYLNVTLQLAFQLKHIIEFGAKLCVFPNVCYIKLTLQKKKRKKISGKFDPLQSPFGFYKFLEVLIEGVKQVF